MLPAMNRPTQRTHESHDIYDALRRRGSVHVISALATCMIGGACGDSAPSSARARRYLTPEEMSALRSEARAALKAELREEVRSELKNELRPAVVAELEREQHVLGQRDPVLPPGGTTDSPEPDVRDAPSASTERPKSEEDLWNKPGTHIWPLGSFPKLIELYVGSGLDEKLPTNIRTRYDAPPEILYCYTVFENPSPNATVTHVWRRGARLVSRVELEVGQSPKWRTWSKQRTQPHWVGTWSCEVLGPDGEQLGLTVFDIGG